jgi:hypothetical protein
VNINKPKHSLCASFVAALILTRQLLVPGIAHASTPNALEHIQPFTAVYDSVWYPLSLKGTASRTLQIKTPNQGAFFFEGKIMGATLQESASLQWKGCLPVPLSFSRVKKHIFSDKIVDQQTFNWQTKEVSVLHKENTAKLAITEGAFDPLSYQLALRCDLKQGKAYFEYSVVRKTKLKRYSFKVVGEERISTPLGELAAVKVERSSDEGNNKQTTLWFSKEHDYMLVKLEQKEANANHYVFTIRQLTFH